MRILLIDDDDGRREILSAHTGAWVVRMMPRALFENPDLLHGADAIALDHDMCEAPDEDAPFAKCPSPSTHDNCTCANGVDVARWLMQRLGALKHGCRIVVVGANTAGAQRMLNILRDPKMGGARKVHIAECNAARWGRYDTTTRRNIRAAFGLPLDWETTP